MVSSGLQRRCDRTNRMDGKYGENGARSAKVILHIGTGVVSRPLPGLDFNGKTVVGSREAMVIEQQPKSMIVIGAGAIGIEFAYFYNAFGTKVTVVEMLPNILPVEDTEVSQTLERSFAKQGIKCLTSTKTTKTEVTAEGVKITVADAKDYKLFIYLNINAI